VAAPLVRAVLYMCTLVAARRNPVLRAFYALLCKLLIMLNALLRHQLPWNPEFAFDSPIVFFRRLSARRRDRGIGICRSSSMYNITLCYIRKPE
jgi:hypothetical protein